MTSEQAPARTPTPRQRLAQALRGVSYEVLPFASAEEAVATHVPTDLPLTVTTTERKGTGPTVDLAVRLARRGYSAAPHLAARNLRDDAHLADVVAQLREGGVDSVFVVGGDARQPAGPFPDALSLLECLDRLGRPFASVGIAGYPEGHGHIGAEELERALVRKAPHATHVLTQLCFDASSIVDWAVEVRGRGVALPVRVGIPGAVNRQKLVRISAGLGLGQSARFLRKQQSLLWRFFAPAGYSPDRLVERLAPSLGRPEHQLAGFHVFTFNEFERTEAWRRDWLARLA
jgi:methylenetetrahydrofolate reductase (NADPH)